MRQAHRPLGPAWVAGSVRARHLLVRRLGRDRARALATSPSLEDALAVLSGTAYGRLVREGMSLAEAQRAVAATALWHIRVLAGWLPPAAIPPVRLLAAWFELANIEERVRYLAGRDAPPPFALGALATAWPTVSGARSAAEVRAGLVGSPGAIRGRRTPRSWGSPCACHGAVACWTRSILPASGPPAPSRCSWRASSSSRGGRRAAWLRTGRPAWARAGRGRPASRRCATRFPRTPRGPWSRSRSPATSGGGRPRGGAGSSVTAAASRGTPTWAGRRSSAAWRCSAFDAWRRLDRRPPLSGMAMTRPSRRRTRRILFLRRAREPRRMPDPQRLRNPPRPPIPPRRRQGGPARTLRLRAGGRAVGGRAKLSCLVARRTRGDRGRLGPSTCSTPRTGRRAYSSAGATSPERGLAEKLGFGPILMDPIGFVMSRKMLGRSRSSSRPRIADRHRAATAAAVRVALDRARAREERVCEAPWKTPPFRGPHGEIVPGSIAEIGYLRLGGLDQWVMIRGESVANPPLILLHGGPGLSETALFRHFNAPLEKSFTVVYWDQRGAGKSFDRGIPRSSMTVEQFIADLDELVERYAAPRQDEGRDLRALLGLALGVLYAARFPRRSRHTSAAADRRLAAAAEAASYAYALAEAQRRGNRRAIKKLRAIGPPPHAAEQLFTERSWLTRLEGRMRPGHCGSSHGPSRPAGSPRSSSCPAPCAASGSPSTRCGLKSRG